MKTRIVVTCHCGQRHEFWHDCDLSLGLMGAMMGPVTFVEQKEEIEHGQGTA